MHTVYCIREDILTDYDAFMRHETNIPAVQHLAHMFRHILQEEILLLSSMEMENARSWILSTWRSFNKLELVLPMQVFMAHQKLIRG
jgi:hypothetical protein